VKTDIETAKKRNAARARKVPEWVIDKQYSKFIQPSRNEGFDDVINV
jgi:predicted kinase